MTSALKQLVRSVLFALLAIVLALPGYADDRTPPAQADGIEAAPTPNPEARQRFSSEKLPPEEAGDEVRGRGLGPYGPAMDGVRGSGIAPAPGAFGTDAGSPDDLRR